MTRWLEVLSQFDFVVQHHIVKKQGNADGPSRIPCEPDGCNCYDGQTILAELPCGDVILVEKGIRSGLPSVQK